MDPFVICALSLPYCRVCFLQPCGHLLGKGWPLGSCVCDVFLCFVAILYGVLGQVWYLIVTIPDLCILPYFINGHHMALWASKVFKIISTLSICDMVP